MEPILKKSPAGARKAETFMPPETFGAMKRDNILHWSIDELINYKITGTRPVMVPNENLIFQLAKMGVSIANLCGVFSITEESFRNNPAFLGAHQDGRAQAGTKIRALIMEDALNGNLQAKMYLDKILGGDQETQKVLIQHQRIPDQIETIELLELTNETEDNPPTSN